MAGFSFDPEVRAASDGSATNVRWPAIARAAWAVAQRVKGTWRVLMGTVGPHLRQNAAVAEHTAAMQAVTHGIKGPLAIDCNVVLFAARRPVPQRVDYRRKHATWWKQRLVTYQPTSDIRWMRMSRWHLNRVQRRRSTSG